MSSGQKTSSESLCLVINPSLCHNSSMPSMTRFHYTQERTIQAFQQPYLPGDSNHGLQCAGEGPCLLTYFVSSYWQLFVLRALTGISIGGCLPLVFNLLGDLFDAQHRANVLSGVLIATGAGTAIGQALAGLIGSAQGALCCILCPLLLCKIA